MKWFWITRQTLVQSVNMCCHTWRTIKPSHPRRGTIKMTLDMSFCKSSEIIRINNNLTWKQTRRVCLPNVWAMIETAHKLGLQPSWKPRHFHNSSPPPTLVSPAVRCAKDKNQNTTDTYGQIGSRELQQFSSKAYCRSLQSLNSS